MVFHFYFHKVVFLLHSLFATGRFENIRIGLNVIVDCVLVYIILLKLLSDNRLMRKFLFAFMLGGLSSGIFGWTNDEFTKAINVSGAGAQTVSRNFGALSDANFAGLFYSLCIVVTVAVKRGCNSEEGLDDVSYEDIINAIVGSV